MWIEKVEEVESNLVFSEDYDLVLSASGYESRAPHLAGQLRGAIKRKIALGFQDRKILHRKRNDELFGRLGYELLLADENDAATPGKCISEILGGTEKIARPLTVLVDYSCMTRVWYAEIIRQFMAGNYADGQVIVTFSYTPSTFVPPAEPSPNQAMDPIPGFCGMGSPQKESALVIGLGYTKERAVGLMDYIDAKVCYAFYTDPAIDPRFVSMVKRNNAEVFRRLGASRMIAYPMADLRGTAARLQSLCGGLTRRGRVMLAPLGPKPFSLLCLILAARDKGISVWRVSSGGSEAAVDRPAARESISCRVHFSRAESPSFQ